MDNTGFADFGRKESLLAALCMEFLGLGTSLARCAVDAPFRVGK